MTRRVGAISSSARVTALGPAGVNVGIWLERMRNYAAKGHAFDLEENEDRIRCVAAPIRDVTGKIVGAISVSGAAQYMDDARMAAMVGDVTATAKSISRDLGWMENARPHVAAPRARRAKASA